MRPIAALVFAVLTVPAVAEEVAPPLQKETLHPAFCLTPAQVAALTEEGRTLARKGKKPEDIQKRFEVRPRWVRGKKGKADAKVWFWENGGMGICAAAYEAERLYQTFPQLDAALKNGQVEETLTFDLVLQSQPSKRRDADEREVRVLRFVLSDDLGHHWVAAEGDTEAKDASGTTVTFGLSPVTSVETAAATADHVGTIGTTPTWGRVDSRARSVRTDLVPWSRETPFYRASYRVTFPTFNEDGRARIGPDVRTLTLRVVTERGEMAAEYRLDEQARRR